MSAKREANHKMIIEIENKIIELDVFADDTWKGIRYELTSETVIEPMDAAFSLWQVVKAICEKQGFDPDVLIKNYAYEVDEDQTKH